MPGAGRKPRPASSALIRNSIECPRGDGSTPDSRWPSAIANCARTRSTPLVSSVTGCSTCSRVLTSRKEIVPSWRDQELARAGADVAGRLGDRLAGGVEPVALVVGQERRRRLLDHLLVPALQRAVAGPDDDDLAVLVGDELGLDMARPVEVALDEALAATERRDRLAHRAVEQLGDLLAGAGDLQAAPAAAERGLDRDRQPVLVGEGQHLVDAGDRVRGAGRERRADVGGDVAGLDLVAERVDRRRRRADPGQPGVDDGRGEAPRSRRGSRSPGCTRVGAGPLRDLEHQRAVEVGLARRVAAERVRLVGQPDVLGVEVGVGVDRHAEQTGVATGTGDPDRDLASVGDQDLAHAQTLLIARPCAHGILARSTGAVRGMLRA